MWSNLALVPLVAFGWFASGQMDTIRFNPPEEFEGTSVGKPWSLEGTLELRASEDRRDRPAQKSQQRVHELSIGGGWKFDSQTRAFAEFSVESIENESQFFVRQAFLDWNIWKDRVQFRIGQQFLPVGLLNERDNWFSSRPAFVDRLLGSSKGIDMGAVASLRPLGEIFYLEGGAFSGRTIRAEDGQNAGPEKEPSFISIKSESKWHSAFLTKFDHDLAFQDAVAALGVGAEVRAPAENFWGGSFLIEAWNFTERQVLGPEQQNRSWWLNGEVRAGPLALGQRYSESRAEVASTRLALEKSSLYFADYQLVKGVHLRAERVIETQDDVLRDDLVGRILVRKVW